MKLPMYTDKKMYAIGLRSLANAIEINGLAQATESLEQAKKGNGRVAFLETNRISPENADREWAHHIEWLQGEVDYLTRKVRNLRKKADKAMA